MGEDKNIVMTLTTGRSGTGLLAALLASADDCFAAHEPEPVFNPVAEGARRNADDTRRFVRETKLPAIRTRAEAHYVETSHLFCKGPFEAFVELGVPFRTIILNRPPRAVADSMWRIGSIPGRTGRFRQSFLLHPEQPGVLSLAAWRQLSDYSLCFWYCLEIERRKSLYKAVCGDRGIVCREIAFNELFDFATLCERVRDLDLTIPEEKADAHRRITAHPVNRRRPFRPLQWIRRKGFDFDRAEAAVWAQLGPDAVSLRRDLGLRYPTASRETAGTG